jgi:energy-converting hydrogenase Eha subunit A
MIRGSVTWGTGSSTATGSQVSITFSATFPSTPVITLAPTTIAAGTIGTYILSSGTTGFVIGAAVAPTASQGATVFGCSWLASL